MVALMALLPGCQKFVDVKDLWHQHNPDCRIAEIAYHSSIGPDTIFAKFNYDNKGRPTRILSSYVHDGRPNHLFRYDSKGRLSNYIGHYAANIMDDVRYDFWIQYHYDARGRVVSDSVHVFGDLINGQPQPNAQINYARYYELDSYGRIIGETRPMPYGVEKAEYIYNAAGNMEVHNEYIDTHLVWSDTLHYDHKVNLHRTNEIWMLIDRDYSQNNRQPADHYNKSGLPLQYRLPETTDLNFLLSIELDHSDIRYQCK